MVDEEIVWCCFFVVGFDIVIFIYILGLIGWLKGCVFMYSNFVEFVCNFVKVFDEVV